MSESAALSAQPRTGVSTTRVVLLVAVAHASTDLYQSFIAPLLPRLIDKLGISIGLAATAAMVLSLSGSLLQPAMGFLADRWGRRTFVLLGPLLSGVFISLVGFAPSLTILLLLLVLGGLGSAVFHPPGASMSARVEAGRGSGARYSIFSLGGTVGFAIGPLLAVGIVDRLGLEGLWVAMVPALLVSFVLWRMLPPDRDHVHIARPRPTPRFLLGALRGPLGLVFGISAVSAFGQRVFMTMEPIVAAEVGASEQVGALMLSVYLGAQAFGTVTGGVLSDRIDRRYLLATLVALAVPSHMLALWLPVGSIGALVFAALSGFLNMAILPPVVVMAQEMVPEGPASSSGIVMGLAWALGSVGVLATGFMADQVGPQTAALWSIPVMLVGALLAVHPNMKRFARPAHA